LIKKLFHNTADHPLIQFVRYMMAGGLAFLVNAVLLFCLTIPDFFQKYYLIAASVSFIAGVIVAYILSVMWVFSRRNVSNKKLEFVLFVAVGVVGLVFNSVIITLCTEILFLKYFPITDKHIRINVSNVVSTAVVFIWNFTARKLALFR
jgi:putative flippase GtrA